MMRGNRRTTNENPRKCKVLFVASEAHPFAKTGGLADVAGSLPKALLGLGHEVAVALPLYKEVALGAFPMDTLTQIEVPMGGEIKRGSLHRMYLEATMPVFFVSQDDYFGRDHLYGDENGDYRDNAERFSFFCRGLLSAIKTIGWKPDIIHCNDWQTALIPLYVKTLYPNDTFYENIGTLFTIHNLAYQGIFPKEKLSVIGLGEEFFVPDRLEFYGKVNVMKAGLVFADLISTVSPTYSKEIQTPEYGFGLDGLLRTRASDICGIVNGIDEQLWDASLDTELAKNYSLRDPEGKRENKRALQEESNLPLIDGPLIGLISRLADQKGLDLIARAAEKIIELPLQLVLLGQGDARYHEIFKQMAKKFPHKIVIHIGFDLAMARRIYAGSDMFLMPSRYEPCGLGQIISLRYGTIPVVRKTGGLADTVKEYDPATKKGYGFLFEEYSSQRMLDALQRAIKVYQNKKEWRQLVRNAMGADFSWKTSAQEYSRLYEALTSTSHCSNRGEQQ